MLLARGPASIAVTKVWSHLSPEEAQPRGMTPGQRIGNEHADALATRGRRPRGPWDRVRAWVETQ
eukprot:435483-Alexandrium_andersonii.AAC.1